MLLEVVATLQHSEGNVKRQWLVDAVEISCVSSYPSTVSTYLQIKISRSLLSLHHEHMHSLNHISATVKTTYVCLILVACHFFS